jgi:hypothetical protein
MTTLLYLLYLDWDSRREAEMNWDSLMRENMVESVFVFLWRYVLVKPLYWWTYPFMRVLWPLINGYLALVEDLGDNIRKIREQKLEAERAAERERVITSALMARGAYAKAVDRTTNSPIPMPDVFRGKSYIDSVTIPGTLKLSAKQKPRIRVRRLPPTYPGSRFRYVRYTHEDGRVDWVVERKLASLEGGFWWSDDVRWRIKTGDA